MAKDGFIYCPQCNSTDLQDADYEDENGENTGELVCGDCGWEGLRGELVCAPTEEDAK